jgi:hypothetical protein
MEASLRHSIYFAALRQQQIGPGTKGIDMKSTTPGSTPTARRSSTSLREGTYLTDGARLLRVMRVDSDGAEVEDARTEQLEWHPVGELASATRAVEPLSIP